MCKLLVIGSLNMDLVIKVPTIPKIGETLLGKSIDYFPGGKGANQAYAAASLGGNVAMIGFVGKDEYGSYLTNNLKNTGVDLTGIKYSDENTGLAFIYVDENSQNSIVVLAGANSLVDNAHIDEMEKLLKACECVILQMEIPKSTVEYVIKKAASLNKRVLLNPAPAPNSFNEELYKMINIITPNETELEKLTGLPVDTREHIIEAAMVLHNKGVSEVIVTCGKNGAILVNSMGSFHFPTPEVKVVDTTAAGDTFTAAIAVALIEGKNINEAITFANCAASLTVMCSGAQSSIPTRDQVEKVIKSRQGYGTYTL